MLLFTKDDIRGLAFESNKLISKASELLELFIEEETKKLSNVKMPHMPTLGAAYEEITKQGIDKDFIIPKHLGLRVVSGFISIRDKILPEQIDCMLVHGKGKKYGLTEQYFYEIENVLCIFEVKKTLRKKDFLDAIDHLASIRGKFAEHFEHKLIHEGYEPDISQARTCFSQITGNIAPEHYSDIHSLSEVDSILFYCLVQEFLAPVSIIHSYDGYSTEKGLRTAFVDILEEKKNETISGMGIPNIPSLVTSNQYCLVKGNGMPYMATDDQGRWVSVSSMRHNSAKIILELIWSKISSHFNVKMPWDDSLYMENASPLLIATVLKDGDKIGWMYRTSEPKEKHLKREDDNVWEPYYIAKAEMSAIDIMVTRGGYLPLNDGMDEYLKTKHESTLDEVSAKLISTRLFMKDGDNIRPIKDQTYIVTLEGNTGYVCSEKDRLDLWCKEKGIPPNYMILTILK